MPPTICSSPQRAAPVAAMRHFPPPVRFVVASSAPQPAPSTATMRRHVAQRSVQVGRHGSAAARPRYSFHSSFKRCRQTRGYARLREIVSLYFNSILMPRRLRGIRATPCALPGRAGDIRARPATPPYFDARFDTLFFLQEAIEPPPPRYAFAAMQQQKCASDMPRSAIRLPQPPTSALAPVLLACAERRRHAKSEQKEGRRALRPRAAHSEARPPSPCASRSSAAPQLMRSEQPQRRILPRYRC